MGYKYFCKPLYLRLTSDPKLHGVSVSALLSAIAGISPGLDKAERVDTV